MFFGVGALSGLLSLLELRVEAAGAAECAILLLFLLCCFVGLLYFVVFFGARSFLATPEGEATILCRLSRRRHTLSEGNPQL